MGSWFPCCLSLFFSLCEFGLQLPNLGLVRQPGLLFGRPAFPLLLEGGYFLPRLRVVPAELPVFPPDKEAQRGAVALQDPVLDLLDGDWLVLPVRQPVTGQSGPVELACFVETSSARTP